MDVDKFTFRLICPHCDFSNPFFFRQAVSHDTIICRGCKLNIYLDDNMNECKKAKRAIKRAIQELEETLQSFSFKITI
jgi:glutaredoxin